MNIFALDIDPKLAAQAHVDAHVVKMILEYAQLMCTTHHLKKSSLDKSKLYKKTHENHPSAVWARSSIANYQWLYSLFTELNTEYGIRYGKFHKSFIDLSEYLSSVPALPDAGLQPVLPAMPDKFKRPLNTFSDSVEAYRNYYINAKQGLHKWTNRKPPTWIGKSVLFT